MSKLIEISLDSSDSGQSARLFHGRGGAYPDLEHVCIDWLPPVALIILYREVSTQWLSGLARSLKEALPGCRSVQVQYRCRPKAPVECLLGEPLETLVVEEAGLKYGIRLGRAQNYGLFLDMRNGRRWVREYARDKNILNLFAYTCGFSVAAIEGGARQVVNVDMSKAALSRGRDNHRLNNHDTGRVVFQGVDIFKSFSRLKRYGPYDLLISDPPAFQKGSVDIKRDYPKILRRVPELVSPGGQLMLCLNSPELTEQFLFDAVEEHCPGCSFVEAVPAPEVFVEAETGKGLKVLVFDFN